MVYFASPEKSVGMIAENLKSQLSSFIWVPWEDTENYIAKSDAILIGPGFMRFGSEKVTERGRIVECDGSCLLTKNITETLIKKFPHKKWVIDAGSLQTMQPEWIPEGAVLTPNRKEFEMLFGIKEHEVSSKGKDLDNSYLQLATKAAKKYHCNIILKGPITYVFSPDECVEVHGGNAGMTKGGTGDTMAGLAVALLAKNDAFLAAKAAAYIVKAAGDDLYKKVGVYYNADDLADNIPNTLHEYIK
jgi:NAD(P)H-hydrate epimerase